MHDTNRDDLHQLVDQIPESGIPTALRLLSSMRGPAPSTENLFRQLLDDWRTATWFMSSIRARTSHPAYLSIIGIGPAALPLILEELEKQPDHWFTALQAITREDLGEENSTLEDLRKLWLDWGPRMDIDESAIRQAFPSLTEGEYQ